MMAHSILAPLLSCLVGASALVSQVKADTTFFIPTGGTWKYLQDGSNQGTNWITPSFNDSAWPSGPTEIGYGDGDEATLISRTNQAGEFIMTTYLRTSFNVVNPGAFVVGGLRVKRDDGVVVYLNGRQIFRDGFPPGDVLFDTPAFNAPDEGMTFLVANFPTSYLVAGQNVIAAEVHQTGPGSSDVSFDLELTGNTNNTPPSVSIVSPGAGAVYTSPATISITASASDSDGTVSLVEFYQGTTKLGEDASSPYTFEWSGVGIGSYTLRAVATDGLLVKGTSAPVAVTVTAATAPGVVSKLPAPGNVSSLSTITVNFSEPVSGVTADDLLVNGVPAIAVSGAGANYQFTIVPPAEGTVYLGWNGTHRIADFENPPKPFDSLGTGATWQYNLTDLTAPTVVSLSPTAGATVRELVSIRVMFSESVSGVEATDLRINGVVAQQVSGTGAGPYEFDFAQPANGVVNLSWGAGHGIRDLSAARNAFAGVGWSYTLNTNAVWDGQIIVNEIMYHPSSELVRDEWVELRNVGTSPVNLMGWRLNRAVEFDFPGTTLAAGGYLVVAADVAAFTAKYPGVGNVVGGWTGRLGNSGDDVELEDPSGSQVDLVAYSDQGDWAGRLTIPGSGWNWASPADGLGRSVELRQAALPNNAGQNWSPSAGTNGTPGRVNSMATNNLPPMILEVTHLPSVPSSSNAITVLARIVDEATSGLTVRLWLRDVSTLTPGAFTSTPMLDNGLSNDGAANDGIYGVVLSPRNAGYIGEFYVEAVDSTGGARTWPAAAEVSSGTFAQEANAFFQVDDSLYTGRQPIYRLIMRASDHSDWFNQFDRVQRNVTLVTFEGGDTQVRYNCGARRRGQSSFRSRPPTMKFDIPRDRPWNNKSSMNLNSVNSYAQVIGSAVALRAGLPAPYTTAVQVRFNGVDESTGGMFGSYAHVEVADGEWARDHFPDDSNGNVYSKRRPECWLDYQGTNPQAYINCAYDKESNASENDWTDLMNLTFAVDIDTTPSNEFPSAMRRNANVELWLRYFAVLFLMNYTETALVNGADDDYDLYRGIVDPRFMIMPHDFDSIFGVEGSTADDIFLAASIPNISRFLHHPEFEQLFYAEYRRQLAGIFATTNLFPLMDQVLGDWVPAGTIQGMKNAAQTRINFVLGAVPTAPNVARATISGEPDSPTYLNTATLNVGGADITQYRYRVNNGAWSADRLVNQPIALTSLANGHYTVYVVGRNSAGTWQADADATVSETWAVLSNLRGVVINEVLARNESGFNHQGTFPDAIELFNAGTGTFDLSGYRLTDDLDDPSKFTFPPGASIAAGAYQILLANNPDATSGLHTGFGLDQNGDTLYLVDRATNGVRILDSVAFGWQLEDRSVGRLANGQWGLGMPTLGAVNTGVPTGSSAALKINEWLASPRSPFVDDFVELYNPGALPVNLSGLALTDAPIGRPRADVIAPLSFIDAFGYRAFIADANGDAGPDHLNFSLSEEGGEIALVGGDYTQIDGIIYGPQSSGVSQGRSPNGSSRIVFLDQPTPGAGNPSTETQSINLLALNGTFPWKYDDTGADLGVAWRATGYNDSAWPAGPAVLGLDSNLQFLEPLRTILNVATPKITYYFRGHFTVPAGVSISGLQATHLIDDGAVFYINGVEVGRFSMPGAPTVITSATLATSHEATQFEVTPLSAASLVSGDNVIAVEIHQNTSTSADLVFGMRLDGQTATGGLRINEVLANARNSTNSDGTISDWVELHNPLSSTVDLSGLSLTDQISNPRRWVIPTGLTISAGGYRVIRFDPDRPASTNLTGPINSGFGLKASGDSIYLFNRQQTGGELIDAVSFGMQAPDFSLSRIPAGSGNWVLSVPTAGGVNIATALGNRGLLKINEWMAAPASGPDWFEIYNPNAQPVELSGLYLTDDLNDRLKFPPLPARSFMAAGLSGFLKIIADNDPAAGPDHVPFALGKSGDEIGLADGYGTLIDSYRFGPQITGVSQGRLPDGTTNVVFFVETPTPEESNYLPIPNVVINEVLTHSDPPLEDAIELRNLSGSSINISGWYLSDARTALQKYRIPNNTSIPANGYIVFYEYRFNPIPNDPGSFSLSSAFGDEVYLSVADAQNQLTGYRAKVDFGAAANGVSFGRYVTSVQNGSKVDFVAMNQRTFGFDTPLTLDDFRAGTGKTNSGPRIGPVVISEVMYHPPDLAGGFDNLNEEYIEIQNLNASPVALFDPAATTNRWRLKDAVSYDFPTNTFIPANGFIVIVGFNPADTTLLTAFKTRYAVQSGAVILGPYSGKLDNSSDSVELARPDPPQTNGAAIGYVPYVLVDKVKYFDTPPWPVTADGAGQSLTRIAPGNYGNDVANWTAASPTPGPQGANPDTDGDGMPNTWETQYGLNPNVNDAALDLDNDGARNLDEYLAGTAPNDANSVLRMTISPGSPLTLRFNAAANVGYVIEYKTTLGPGAWTTLQNVAAGAARPVQITDPASGARRFYHIRTP